MSSEHYSSLQYEQYNEEPTPTKALERDNSSLQLSEVEERTESNRYKDNLLISSIQGIDIFRT
jgi:hypothetical protein